PTFQVVPSSIPSPASTSPRPVSTNEPPSTANPRSTPTSSTPSAASTPSVPSTPSAPSTPTNRQARSSNSKNSNQILTIAVSVTCTALGLIFLGALTYFLVRWRKARLLSVLPVRNLSPFLARAPDSSGSGATTSTRRTKRSDARGNEAPPPYVSL
ncbi:hypothetical protein C8R46DRAFT_1343891, partial [Mycena filopes]